MKDIREERKMKEAMEEFDVKCPRCKGEKTVLIGLLRIGGGIEMRRVQCSDCNGTGKIKWKWEPKIGDEVCRGGMILFYAGIIPAIDGKRAGRFISDAGTEYEWPISTVTPIIPWEEVERILEAMGYIFEEPIRRCYGSEGYKCHCVIKKKISFPKQLLGFGWGETRKEAVREAVLKLRKELKKKEKEG